MTSALDSILDRTQPVRDVSEGFAPQLALLRDVVNYGTNLIPRCFESSPKAVADFVIISALLKQSVCMLDGVELHVSNAAVLASHVPLRSLYESHLSLLWILKTDTDRRARQYYVWNIRQRKLWAERIVPGTKASSEFQHALQHLPTLQSSDPADQQQVQELRKHAQKEIRDIDSLLNTSVYKAINDAFDQHWKKPYDPPWHAPNGVPSIRQMAKDLDLLHEYDALYGSLSSIAHSSAFGNHTSVRGDTIVFQPIRYLESVDYVFRLSLSVAFRTFRAALTRYRPGEIDNFNRKYTAEWREPFQSIPSVKYNEQLVAAP